MYLRFCQYFSKTRHSTKRTGEKAPHKQAWYRVRQTLGDGTDQAKQEEINVI